MRTLTVYEIQAVHGSGVLGTAMGMTLLGAAIATQGLTAGLAVRFAQPYVTPLAMESIKVASVGILGSLIADSI